MVYNRHQAKIDVVTFSHLLLGTFLYRRILLEGFVGLGHLTPDHMCFQRSKVFGEINNLRTKSGEKGVLLLLWQSK